MSDDILGQLSGRSPRRVLEDLVVLGNAFAKVDRARPEVEVYLASGALMRGRPLGIADVGGGAILTLHVGGNAQHPSVSFVRIDQIAAVTVTDASVLVKSPVSDAPVPSRLELQRQANAKAEALATALGRAVPITIPADLDDDSRRAAAAVLPMVTDVLVAIAGDDMGREALAAITEVVVSGGSSRDVHRDGTTLAVRAPKLLTEVFTPATLRVAIEKLL